MTWRALLVVETRLLSALAEVRAAQAALTDTQTLDPVPGLLHTGSTDDEAEDIDRLERLDTARIVEILE